MQFEEEFKQIISLEKQRWQKPDEWERITLQIKLLLEGILKADLNNTKALINLGAILSDGGHYEEALQTLQKAKDFQSLDRNLYRNIAYVMVYLSRSEDEYRPYLTEAKSKVPDPFTFEAYFDPHAH